MKPQENNAEGFKTHKGKYLTNDMTFTCRYNDPAQSPQVNLDDIA